MLNKFIPYNNDDSSHSSVKWYINWVPVSIENTSKWVNHDYSSHLESTKIWIPNKVLEKICLSVWTLIEKITK